MSENDFLNKYKKASEGEEPEKPGKPPKAPDVKKTGPKAAAPDAPAPQRAGYFEQKSGFRPPRAAKETPPAAERSRGSRRAVTAGICVAAAVITAAVILVVSLSGGVRVPDFTGYAVNDVSLWCSQNGINLRRTEEYSDTVPDKSVIRQETEAGAKLRKNDFLSVTVSLGYDLSVEIELPDIASMDKASLERWAQENHMTKVRIVAESSDTVPAGSVIRFTVNDDTVVGGTVFRSSPVYITVSSGHAPAAMVEIPDFSMMSEAEIYLFGQKNGIEINIVQAYNDLVAEGSVIRQSAAPRSKAEAGSTVTVTVSKGKKRIVPDFSVFTLEEAREFASGSGIRVSFKEKYSSDAGEGEFISQSAAPGSVLDPAGVITVCYSLGQEVVAESFAGQPLYMIEDWVKERNEKGASLQLKVVYTQNGAGKNTVISQDPSGTKIPVTGGIRVVVSQGLRVAVPSLVAEKGALYDTAVTRAEAIRLCEEAGLVPVFVEKFNYSRLPGEVWSQSYNPGYEVDVGTVIVLNYCPASRTFKVPDFRTKTREEVIKYMNVLKIKVTEGPEPVAGYGLRVYEQSVIPGRIVAYGTEVEVWISPPQPAEY